MNFMAITIITGFTARRCSFTDDGNCFYTFFVAVDDSNDDYVLLPLEIERSLR